MLNDIKAVIFDMDGVIIDSEPLWRRVMIDNFTSLGIPFDDESCRKTTGLRFDEVAAYWFELYHIQKNTIPEFSKKVINDLCYLISEEGKLMPGVLQFIEYIKHRGIKIGLGTSSNQQLMNHVLKTLSISQYFDALSSAENMKYGKPHPQVFLTCAERLNVLPHDCLVVEDSVNGLIAGKAAQMKVLVIPDKESKHKIAFEIADYKLESLEDFTTLN